MPDCVNKIVYKKRYPEHGMGLLDSLSLCFGFKREFFGSVTTDAFFPFQSTMQVSRLKVTVISVFTLQLPSGEESPSTTEYVFFIMPYALAAPTGSLFTSASPSL